MSLPFEPNKPFVLVSVKSVHHQTPEKPPVACDLSADDKQTILGYPVHYRQNQQWIFEDVGNGNYHIKNVEFGKYITFPDDPNNGKQVIATDGPREWEVRVGNEGVNVKDERASIRIFHPGTEQNLDVPDEADAEDKRLVQLWNRTPGQNQAWYLEAPRE